MFDNKPTTEAVGAVAALAISTTNSGERKSFHYIENIFDPDKHPIEDLTKYVVPQELELVFDVPNGMIYYVSKVDWQATLKSSLVPWPIVNINSSGTIEQDTIFGNRGGLLNGEALLAIDFSVRPPVARVDATVMRPGAAYALVYKGTDPSGNGKVISATYDNSQNLLNNRVPCKLAEIVDRTNSSIMTTGSFSVTENELALSDGVRCTLAFYDQGGNFIPPEQPLVVQHCAYMKDHQIGTRYIESVELISPWFTNTGEPETLMVPINVNLLSVELRARVNYSGGGSEDYPVNGTKFNLYGINEYRPTWVGQRSEIALVYKLATDEQFLLAKPGNPEFEPRIYTIQADAVKGAYSPRIYTYPQWDTATGRYKLVHFLYDLDRKTRLDVTAYVKLSDSSPAFIPTLYGTLQELSFVLNLRDVNTTYQSVTFKQHIGVVLYKDINGPGKRWDVTYASGMPYFGGKVATATNKSTATTFNLSVNNGFSAYDKWLEGMYYAVLPSFNSRIETKAPPPTHFDLMDETGRKWRFPVASWNKDNLIGVEMQKGKTFYISWLIVNANGSELQLGITGVTVEVA